MKILIVGLGTIGEPLARLFLKLQSKLGIEEVIVHKNSPDPKYRAMLGRFRRFGAKLAVYAERWDEFDRLLSPLGFKPDYNFEAALSEADVVIDCAKEGIGRRMKEKYYANLANDLLKQRLFIAQGSEKGFGKPFAFDINDTALNRDTDRFAQVVSCNTHQILCILKTLAGPSGYGNIQSARFTIARRASDISQISSTVGIEVSPPVSSVFGSHQGEDAARVLETLGVKLDIHTTALKVNNSFMHVVTFDIRLKEKLTVAEARNRFADNPLTAGTEWLTNNEVFSAGRDWGHFGRILNQTVVCMPSIGVSSDGREVHGVCFTPQDGNALLSSVAATLWFKNPKVYREQIRQHFYDLPFLFDEV